MTETNGSHPTRLGESDEAILARCIDRFPQRADTEIDRACAGDPDRAAHLRERLAALQRLGLVPDRNPAGVPASIGRYAILGFLGEGGMGAVYLGVDEHLDRNVAIKISHAAIGASEAGARSRARFEREIRAVAKLEHPGIVSIHDVGESEGRLYFTMEYVEGATLARIVEELRERRIAFDQLTVEVLRETVDSCASSADSRGEPTAESTSWGATYVETVCRWILQIADALAHAHAHAIVHRDVKPANVMVRRDGRTKLFDLGLARLGEEPALTRSGDLAGSPFYMSPEQVSGPPERVDRRTDVYSLGVTLFEMLTLQRPFEGPTSAQVFRQIASREPPLPRRINPLVPRDLETICLTALEKDPERRYPSIEEFAADLRRLLALLPVRAKPVGGARRALRFARRNPALASATLLGGLVLVGLPVGLLWSNSAVRAEQRRVAREAELKSRVTEFLVDQFRLSEADRGQGATISARELLDRGAERLEASFEDDPLVRAELYEATGTVYANLGLHERAIPLLDRALAIRQSTVGQDPRALAGLLDALAGSHLASGHPETARRLCERGLDLLDEAKSSGGREAVQLRITLSEAAGRLGDQGEVERSLTRALESLRVLEGAEGQDTASVLERLGVVAHERGDLEVARERLAEALTLLRRAWSPDVGRIARVIGELARVDEARGDADRAESGRKEVARLAGSPRVPEPAIRLPFVLDADWRAEYERSFQSGITSLQSREIERAISAFTRCLELDPSRSVCAYNIACAHAIAGDVPRGLEWLGRAADAGFGVEDYRLRVASTDPEIANLRDDPRGREILDRMRRHGERVRRFAEEPAVRVSPSSSDGGAHALLVVLHAEGHTKLDVVGGRWARLAEELGATLLAPSGSVPTASEPEDGMTWLEEPGELVDGPMECERSVGEAVRAFLEDHEVDRERVWIAGEGLGGMVAFDIALRAPGLYKAVLLVDGPIHPRTSLENARRAASLGLAAAVVIFEGHPSARSQAPEVAHRIQEWLLQCGFKEPRVRIGDAASGPNGRMALLREVLKGFDG